LLLEKIPGAGLFNVKKKIQMRHLENVSCRVSLRWETILIS
jgi:hypothetical protein